MSDYITDPVYAANPARYDGTMPYRRAGVSGLDLPALSLGFWHNFGNTKDFDTQRAVVRRAFDLGITHFDLANNYGPPPGSAEENFGRLLASDLKPYRDEIVVSSKAGYLMWPGPYGDGGSRKYMLASLDQSLRRLGLDYVDIFYHHRFDDTVPLEESMGALATAVKSGRALYAGVSNYTAAQAQRASEILASDGVPLLVQQEKYNMFERRIQTTGADGVNAESVLDAAGRLGTGITVFSPLCQGLLTDRYLHGIPADSRAAVGHFLTPDEITDDYLDRARTLNEIAAARGQTLAQLALAWILRDQRVTSALIGASSVHQLEQNVAAVANLDLTAEELSAIDAACTGYVPD